MQFADRHEAGRMLAKQLRKYRDLANTLVLGLPRGGIPVAYEVAQALRAPLDVFVVRKLGVPGHEELAFGAIATGDVRVLIPSVVRHMDITNDEIDDIAADEQIELDRRERAYRDGRPAPDIEGKTIILVDDGLATGATMRAAILALRQQMPAKVVVGVPTAAPEICEEFRLLADDIVCAITPDPFRAVGLWYQDFSQTTDEEVRALLRETAQTA